MINKTNILSLLMALVIAVPAGGCQRHAKGTEKKKATALPVKAEPARAMDVAHHVFLSGEVMADVEVRVFSLIPERITRLSFEEGQVVKEGETLAVIKGGVLWQSVQQAQAGLAAAKTQKDLAKIELDRTAGLYKSNTVAVAMLQRAQAQYNVAESQVKQMEAAVGTTYQNISNVVIKAPITGIVGQRFLSAGDLAGPGIPLCSIIQIDSVRVKAMATEFDLVQLKPKQAAEVTLPAMPDRSWTGVVDFIAPVVDRMTRSSWVTVLVKNADQALRPGMFGDMKVTVGQRKAAVMIPARALNRWVDEAGKITHAVYLVKDGLARQRYVTVGRRDGDLIEITKGLAPGEVVVVVGNHRLRDKLKVKVVKPTAAESGLPSSSAPPAAPSATPAAPAAAPRRT